MRPVAWIGPTKSDLRAMPEEVQDEIGYTLERVQGGSVPANVSPPHGDLVGVCEIKSSKEGGAYRLMYTTKLGDMIYVLDVFQKKSKKGMATSRRDLNRIRQRLKDAQHHHGGFYEKT